jgi:arylsulfatase A-like enzyme
MLDDQVLQEQPDQAALTERYTAECVRFLRGQRSEPFFLYLAHMYVHAPIYAPQRFLHESANGAYGAAVACVDWSTRVLLAELESLGLAEDTLVVFTSDNGSRGHSGASNAPLRGAKGTTWEGGIRVPCIVSWPAAIPPGQVRGDLATSLDLLPTFVELAGGTLGEGPPIDGVSLVEMLTGPTGSLGPRSELAYWHRDILEAVRVGRWKLHLWRDGREASALYDVVDDPAESRDRLDEQPDVVEALRQVADRLRAELGDARLGTVGSGSRPVGRVPAPRPLTHYRANHPYLVAEYDLPDRG